jgi:D-xylose transport system permease protein
MSTAAGAQPTPAPPGSQTAAAAAAGPGSTGSVADHARAWWQGVRGGELGSLPIIIGLIIIAVVFQVQNSNFLTAGNFVNLIVQAAAIMTIGMGVVFVLLLGEIDLSIGYVSGVGGVMTALLLLDDGNAIGAIPAIVIAVLVGVGIGMLHGVLITKIGIPSFVVTLAGLLGWQGVVLLLIGDRGTVTLQDSTVVGFANDFLAPATAWIVLLACVGVYAATQVSGRMARRRAGLPIDPDVLIVVRVAILLVIGGIVVAVANQDRGIPYVFLVLAVLYLVWSYVLGRTKFGRYVYAVGGNAEASRRAGINVDRVKIAVFAICSAMAALGGIILASRLRSVDTGAGGGQILLYSIAAPVIGGTSLFGGRGHVKSALLGALVIASIDNGLGLLGLGSGQKFVITGLVLLLAVAVDSVSRRRQATTGRA